MYNLKTETMSIDNAKSEYRILLENGELLEMFPNFTGQWAKDKKEFIKFHEMNEEILNFNIDFDFEDGAEDFYED